MRDRRRVTPGTVLQQGRFTSEKRKVTRCVVFRGLVRLHEHRPASHLNRFTIQKSRGGPQFRILPAIVTAEKFCRAPCGVPANKRCLACLLTMKSVQPLSEAGTMLLGPGRALVFYFRITARLRIDRYQREITLVYVSSLACRDQVTFRKINSRVVVRFIRIFENCE